MDSGYGFIDLSICVLLKGVKVQPDCSFEKHWILPINQTVNVKRRFSNEIHTISILSNSGSNLNKQKTGAR
jgi:glutaredoxin-related protein